MEDQIQDQLLRIKGFLDVLGLCKGFVRASWRLINHQKPVRSDKGLFYDPGFNRESLFWQKKHNQKQNHRKKKTTRQEESPEKKNTRKNKAKLDRPQFFFCLLFSCFLFFLVFGFLVCFFVCSVFFMKPHILYAVGLIRLIDRWSCWPSPDFIKPMVSRAHKWCLGLGCNPLQP